MADAGKTTTDGGPFWRNRLKLALAASIALNLFAATFLLGGAIAGGGDETRRAGGFRAMLDRAGPETQAAFKAVREENRAAIDAQRGRRAEAEAAWRAALAVEPFEPEAYRQAREAYSSERAALRALYGSIFDEVAGRLSPEARSELAALLAERARKREERRRARRERD